MQKGGTYLQTCQLMVGFLIMIYLATHLDKPFYKVFLQQQETPFPCSHTLVHKAFTARHKVLTVRNYPYGAPLAEVAFPSR